MAENPHCEIAVTGSGRPALVDACDLAFVSGMAWHLNEGYARSGSATGKVYMHRLLLGVSGDLHSDHRNRDRLDNRRANLRAVTQAQNNQNVSKRPGLTSRYRGVRLHASGRWSAQVHIAGRQHYLGYFTDEDEAGRVAAAYRARMLPFSEA